MTDERIATGIKQLKASIEYREDCPGGIDWKHDYVSCIAENAAAIIDHIAAQDARLAKLEDVAAAAPPFIGMYIRLAESGDCGFWDVHDPNVEPELHALKAALDALGAGE